MERIRNTILWKTIAPRKTVGSYTYDAGAHLPGQWHLFIKMATDWHVSEAGDTCRPAAGPVSRWSVQIEWISAWTANRGFSALLSVPHLLAREIIMNRHHCEPRYAVCSPTHDQYPTFHIQRLTSFCCSTLLSSSLLLSKRLQTLSQLFLHVHVPTPNIRL